MKSQIKLTRWEYFKAVLAKRLVLLAGMISPLAVLSLCLEIGREYTSAIELQETGDE